MHAGRDIARDRILFFNGGGNCTRHAIHALNGVGHFLHGAHRIAGGRLNGGDLRADLFRRARGLRCQGLHFGCHNREALAGITSTRGFNRGIQSKKIGLAGDIGDQPHHITDLIRRFRKPAYSGPGRMGAFNRILGRACRFRHLARDFGD